MYQHVRIALQLGELLVTVNKLEDTLENLNLTSEQRDMLLDSLLDMKDAERELTAMYHGTYRMGGGS